MQLMVTGDKWELYIPSELAYGDRGSPPKIPGGSVLIFQMEIISSTYNMRNIDNEDDDTRCAPPGGFASKYYPRRRRIALGKWNHDL